MGKLVHGNRRSGWSVEAEEFAVHLVVARKVVHIHEKRINVDDVC